MTRIDFLRLSDEQAEKILGDLKSRRVTAQKFPCRFCGQEHDGYSGAVEVRIEVKAAVLLAKGYLYILSNPAMPGLLKIGLTMRTVPDRVAELSAATGVPSAFTVEAYFESSDPQRHERVVHRKLHQRRVAGKEFFRVRLDEAVECLRAVTGNLPLGNPRQLSEEERSLMDLRDHIIASGRSAPPVRRCGACHYTFFCADEVERCPRCGGKV